MLLKNPNKVTAKTLMWVKALDLLMDKLIIASVDFSKIVAISGTAQVSWKILFVSAILQCLTSRESFLFGKLRYAQICLFMHCIATIKISSAQASPLDLKNEQNTALQLQRFDVNDLERQMYKRKWC